MLAELDAPHAVRHLAPDLAAVSTLDARGLIVTALVSGCSSWPRK
jgi:hypothetical protein